MTNATTLHTASINCSWTVGADRDAVFPMLARADDDCGFTQQVVSGTAEDFTAAHAVCVAMHKTADQHVKRNLTRLMRTFGQIIRCANLA